MDIKQIHELIKLVKKTEISELKVKEGDLAITIKNKGNDPPAVYTTPVSMPAVTTAPAAKTETAKADVSEKQPTAAPAANNDNLVTFRSPMVGTFYRRPSADKDVYVKVGDSIQSGDVLCIIEAMKLFNEIEFDGAPGKIVKILADDASPVEYDQPLFLIEKA